MIVATSTNKNQVAKPKRRSSVNKNPLKKAAVKDANAPVKKASVSLVKDTPVKKVAVKDMETQEKKAPPKMSAAKACPDLPPDWIAFTRTRATGLRAGNVDYYYQNPAGETFRSLQEVAKHMSKHNVRW